jgi:hypothetical protein
MGYLNPTAGQAREATGTTETAALLTALPTAAVANVATADADATYGAPEAALINELKVQLNALLAALRTAGIVTP